MGGVVYTAPMRTLNLLSRRPLPSALFGVATLVLAGCGNDLKIAQSARCDGIQEGTETTVDSPFDADQDGFFDGANPDCQTTYAAADLDCNDQDPSIHPGAPEVTCDGIDNDCDATTPDSQDADGDGFNSCVDCQDEMATINPDAPEIVCDGYDNDCNAATPDETDADSDGYGSCTDCADGDPNVNPGTAEITCDGIDNDCNPATVDGPDIDGDGASACIDCDDTDPTRSPTFTEICGDGIDNDCNGEVDDGCDVDYTGIYVLDHEASYSCAFGIVSISVHDLTVIDANPVIEFSSSGTQPGTMSGTIDASDAFTTSNVLRGSCTETYGFNGSFTGPDTFTGTLTASYSGSCFDCSNQSWTVTGNR